MDSDAGMVQEVSEVTPSVSYNCRSQNLFDLCGRLRIGFAAGCEATALPRRQRSSCEWAAPLVRAPPLILAAFASK